MKLDKTNLPLWIILVIGFLSLLDPLIPYGRYLKYLIFPFCLFVLFLEKRHEIIIDSYIIPFYFYIFFCLIYLTVGQFRRVEDAVGDLLFALTYIIPFVFWRQKIELKNVFNLAVIVFFLLSLVKLNSGFTFDLLASVSTFEHNEFGFIFAIFFIYFVTHKNYKFAFIALFLTVITLKRIALVGVSVALIVFYTKNIWYHKRFYIALFFGVANIFLVVVMKFASSEEFNTLSYKLFGLSANHVLMGRAVLYGYIFDHAPMNWFYGQGPGSVYEYASTAFDSTSKILLHSDILKMSFEFGLVFCFLFFFLLYFSSVRYIEYLAFLNVVMISDNPLIYSSVMFFLFLVINNNEKSCSLSRSRALS